MKSISKKFRLTIGINSLILIFVFSIFSISTNFVRAAENNGQGIQISPVRIELNADKGKTYQLKIKVTNVTAGELVLTPEVNDFRAKDEKGTPEIIFKDENSRQFSLKSWISLPSNFNLKSKESKEIIATVTLPPDAEAGGHYGVIRFSGRPPDLADTGVSLAASIGTLVLTRVGGDIKEELEVEEFFTMRNQTKTGFFESSPITFVERLKNTGTVHVKPNGTVEIKNMFGKSVSSLKINSDNSRNVLPSSISRFEQTLKKSWMFGRYSADINIGYGTTGGLIQSSIIFWVIPWKLIIAGLVLLILIILIFRKMIKGYNKRILAKHGRR